MNWLSPRTHPKTHPLQSKPHNFIQATQRGRNVFTETRSIVEFISEFSFYLPFLAGIFEVAQKDKQKEKKEGGRRELQRRK